MLSTNYARHDVDDNITLCLILPSKLSSSASKVTVFSNMIRELPAGLPGDLPLLTKWERTFLVRVFTVMKHAAKLSSLLILHCNREERDLKSCIEDSRAHSPALSTLSPIGSRPYRFTMSFPAGALTVSIVSIASLFALGPPVCSLPFLGQNSPNHFWLVFGAGSGYERVHCIQNRCYNVEVL